MVVCEVFRCHKGNGNNFTIWNTSMHITLVFNCRKCSVNDHKSRYNPIDVHYESFADFLVAQIS